MSKKTLIVIGIIILFIVGALAWYANSEGNEPVEEGVIGTIHPNPPLPAATGAQQ